MRSKSFLINAAQDFVLSMRTHQEAVHFISRHKLWRGLLAYGWVSKLILAMGLVAGWKLYSIFSSWWNSSSMNSLGMAVQDIGRLIQSVALEGYAFFFVGGYKYLILVVMEILLFHVCRRTLEIKTGQKQDLAFATFVQAEIRMIKAAIFAFVMESLGTLLLGIFLPMLGMEFWQPILIILLQCYFLGFVVLDNYSEIYGLDIQQSERVTRAFFGVAMAIGLVTYVLLLMPILGAILAPFIGAVTATLSMHALHGEFQQFIPVQEEVI
ncbi:MAG: EI24 domain-containing protein [Bacteroidota bacterium]